MGAPATAAKAGTRTAAARRSAAAAPARRTTPKRAPARRSRQATPIPGRLVPVAVGRTAVAVASLPDSGLVVRLTRGRLWIAALAALLVGIVALNVVSLNLSASSSETARALEQLEGENSALRGRLATELSSRRVQSAAGALGLVVPEPGAIRYRSPSEGDAETAAGRLRSGELAATTQLEVDPETVPAVPEPVVPPPAEPAPAPVEGVP